MSSRPPLSPEVRALLDRERVIAPVSEAVRTRALARARAAVIAGRVGAPAMAAPISKAGFWVLGAAAFVATAAIAATAYEFGVHSGPAVETPAAVSSAHVVQTAEVPPSPAPEHVAEGSTVPTSEPMPPARAPRSSQADPGPDELGLLGQARAAVARQDFAAALSPIAEHARRFGNGRFTEEREALRVKALSGLGRSDEARRAANSFESRFPHSVLLPAVSHMPASGK